jgi:hypothetical protein
MKSRVCFLDYDGKDNMRGGSFLTKKQKDYRKDFEV